ncbi:hypothetical protein CU048_11785 [Beijerinckiaceae bacterium]|nr:hypothetical protein CU048_11785 [Beijerinckiaceae bacterium]
MDPPFVRTGPRISGSRGSRAARRRYASLTKSFPKIRILGGCCGTDHRHVADLPRSRGRSATCRQALVASLPLRYTEPYDARAPPKSSGQRCAR